MTLAKNFKLTERIGMQFRVEFFNGFNKVQFRADQNNFQLANQAAGCTNAVLVFNTNCTGHAVNTVAFNYARDGQGNFGRITGDRGPREIQYALKFTF